MDLQAFEKSAIDGTAMPAGLGNALEALWLARAGQWDSAHDRCQNIPGAAGSWIHAHLHRQEGDLGNAAYWYARAGKPTPPAAITIEQEWRTIAAELAEK